MRLLRPRCGSPARAGLAPPLPASASVRRSQSAIRPAQRAQILAVALASACALPLPLVAATFMVDATGDSTDATAGDGLCRDNAAQCSLRAAIQEANALPGSDEVILPAGNVVLATGGTGENASASGDLDVRSDVRISGAGSTASVIDGGGLDRIFDVGAGNRLTLVQLGLRNGRQSVFAHADPAEISGGAVLVRSGGSAVLQQVDVSGNSSAHNGHGLAVFGSLQALQLRVRDNGNLDEFVIGGGLFIGASASVVDLQACEFQNNHAAFGGAIYGDGSATAVTLQRCLLSGNSAAAGGAIHANLGASQWLLRNTTLSGNQADAGGAIFGDGQNELRLEHCTISANHATGANGGGAIFDVRGGASDDFIPIELSNSIVLGNTQTTGRECNTVFPTVIVSAGGTVHAPGDACILRAGSGDIVTADAGLVPLADNGGFTRTHALHAGSRAIDAALPAACAATDQRGQPRPQDGDGDGEARCDIGAYERSDVLYANGFDDPLK